MFYSAFPRLAALAGTNILLAPANVGLTTDFMKVRTWENDFSMIVANRFGHGGKGSKSAFFNEDTFAIPSPCAYDFSGSQTAIVSNRQEVLAAVSGDNAQIAYAELPIRKSRVLPVVRRPSLYPLLAQDTLESYTFKQFGLPVDSTFAVAAVDPGPQSDPWDGALEVARRTIDAATAKSMLLKLIVFPSNYFLASDSNGIAKLKAFAEGNGTDIVIQLPDTVPPQSLMLASNGSTYTYARTHRLRRENIPDGKLGAHYWIVDRDYARVALLQDVDLMAPETSLMMEKLGVDIVAMNANTPLPIAGALWTSRTADYYNIVVANRQGTEGVYLGGYPPGPQSIEAEGMALTQIDTNNVRVKKHARFLDFKALPEPCGAENC
jgi:predicted amidohydrolase